MSTTTLILILCLLVALAAFLHVAVGARRLEARRNARVAAEAAQAPPPAAAPAPDAPAGAAVPSPFLPAPDGPPDDLMAIKGIGPKLAARLSELGVFHYRQIAGWTPEQLAEVDAQLGAFQGRPERDRWQSQARLLAAGDIRGYERAHGKLGPGTGPAA